MSETGHNTKVYIEQGGAKLVGVAGGTIDLTGGAALIFPTADPHVVGAVWNNSGTLTISAG